MSSSRMSSMTALPARAILRLAAFRRPPLNNLGQRDSWCRRSVAGDVLADDHFHVFGQLAAGDLGHRAVGGDDPAPRPAGRNRRPCSRCGRALGAPWRGCGPGTTGLARRSPLAADFGRRRCWRPCRRVPLWLPPCFQVLRHFGRRRLGDAARASASCRPSWAAAQGVGVLPSAASAMPGAASGVAAFAASAFRMRPRLLRCRRRRMACRVFRGCPAAICSAGASSARPRWAPSGRCRAVRSRTARWPSGREAACTSGLSVVDHDGVGHHVLGHGGIQADLRHFAVEGLVGVGVDGEVDVQPGWMRPMSASLTEAQTCIRVRSLASRNRLGALRWKRRSGPR